MTTIYLLHLQPPYKHARHYLGSADDLNKRLGEHRAGRGARLTQAAVAHGCRLVVAAIWTGDRTIEQRLKRRKNSPKLCPICCGKEGAG